MMDYPLTVPYLLDRAARYFPAVEVVSRRPDRSIARSSYAEVCRRAHQLAGGLAGLGVGRGDRVASLGWNHARHLEAYFGVPLMGGVLHTLNPRLPVEDLAYVMNHAGDSVLLVDDVLLPVLERVRDRVSLRHIVVWTNGTSAPEGMIDYEEFIDTQPEEFARPRLDEGEAACMCYTSGTTGQPKGVVYTHRSNSLHAFGPCLADTLAISHCDTLLPVVPLFHANAWGLPHRHHDGHQARPAWAAPGRESLLDLIQRARHDHRRSADDLDGHPRGARERARPLEARPDLRMVVGGSAAPEGLIRAFDRHGLRVVHAWGMTEMSPVGSVSCSSLARRLPEDECYASARAGPARPGRRGG